MGEINERETEIREAREKLLQFEEDTRQMQVTAEKTRNERDYIVADLK